MTPWVLFLAGLVVTVSFGMCLPARRLAFLLMVGFVLVMSIYHGLDGISGEGLNEAVIYHMASGLAGVGLAGQGPYLALWVALLTAGVAVSAVLASKLPNRGEWAVQHVVALVLFSSAIYTAPLSVQFRHQFPLIHNMVEQRLFPEKGRSQLGPLREKFLVPESGDLEFSDRNIVWIFMEGVEKSFFDKVRFGSLLPRLEALSDQAIRFQSMEQSYLTGWTMGGLVGAQCGVPLAAFGNSGINDLVGFHRFLPGAHCVGDLLSQAGYHTEFIGGASLTFAGKGDFLRSHGYGQLWGREELNASFGAGKAKNEWGYYDEDMLAFARTRFDSLYESESPFLLTLLTLDSHPPRGFLSPRCRGQVIQGDDAILDALRCTDFLVSEFVQYVKERDVENNTLVILVTDHYMHNNSQFEKLQEAPRELVFWAFPPDDTEGQELEVRGQTYDVGPTVLALVGSDLAGLGFGRNLLRVPLGAEVEADQLAENIVQLTQFLWQPSGLDFDISLDRSSRHVQLADQRYRFPAIFEFDANFRLTKVIWPSEREPLLAKFDAHNSLMVAGCEWMIDSQADEGVCAYFRSMSGDYSAHRIEGSRLTGELARAILSEEVKAEQWNKEEAVFVFSSGGHGQFSGIYAAGESLRLPRGINLLEVSHGGVVSLGRFDTCQSGISPGDLADKELDRMIQNAQGKLIVAVSDSAVCGEAHLQPIAERLGSSVLGILGFREPYIAELDSEGVLLWEASAPREERVLHKTGL